MGRPTKQYNLIRVEPNGDPQNKPASSDEEDVNWYEIEFVMNSMEIPFKEAIVGSDQGEWKNAIYSEIKSLIENDTWKIVDRSIGARVFGCRTVLRNKYGSQWIFGMS